MSVGNKPILPQPRSIKCKRARKSKSLSMLGRVVKVFVVLVGVSIAYGEDFSVPVDKLGGDKPETMMRRYLLQQVEQAGQRWKERYETLQTPEQIAAYQEQLREKFVAAIGGFPSGRRLSRKWSARLTVPAIAWRRSSLRASPKHYVTALLFLPQGAIQAALSGRDRSLRPLRRGEGIRDLSVNGRAAGAQRHGGIGVRSD